MSYVCRLFIILKQFQVVAHLFYPFFVAEYQSVSDQSE